MSLPKKWAIRQPAVSAYFLIAQALLLILAPRAWTYFDGLHGNLGVGATYFRYQQSTLRQPVRQTYVTLKGGLTFVPQYSPFEFSANAFGSVGQIRHVPSEYRAAQVLGYNGRVAFRLLNPRRPPKGVYFKIHAGFYRFNATVSDRSYGIRNLSGPQGMISMHSKYKKRPMTYSAYLKYAPITSNFQDLNPLNNREIAAGIAILVSADYHQPSTYLTIDFSSLNFRIRGVPSIKMQSYSLGLSVGF